MSSFKTAKILTLFVLLSFLVQNGECYLTVVDPRIYRTVNNFADECVKFRHFKGFLKKLKQRKKKKNKFKLQDEVCFEVRQKYCTTEEQKPGWTSKSTSLKH